MSMIIEYNLFKFTKVTQPYVKPHHGSQKSVNLSNSLLSNNLRFNPKKGFPSLVVRTNSKRKLIVYSSVDPGPPAPGSPFSSLSWVVAIAISVIIPLISFKWGTSLKNRVDTTLQRTEDLAEAVVEVAEVVDKVAEELEKDLPQGGKLRRAVDYVENLAERAAKDAGAIDDFIDKVQEEQKETESLVQSLKFIRSKNSVEESNEDKTSVVESISEKLSDPSQERNDTTSNSQL